MLPLRPRVVGDREEAAGPRPPPGRQEDEQEIKFQVKDFRIKSSGNSFEFLKTLLFGSKIRIKV